MPKISVIVPVYKAEDFIGNCIESVLAQTFPDFELFMVVDGSPDNSAAVCRKYSENDSRIIVIEKENGGVSSARNEALEHINGEHVVFIDSDDYIAPDMFQKFMNRSEETGADTVGCAHFNVRNGQTEKEKGVFPAGVYGKSDISTGIINRLLNERIGKSDALLNGYIWRWFFDASIIRDNALRFHGNYLEDEIFLLEYFCHSGKFATIDDALYYYVNNPTSITKSYQKDYLNTFLNSVELKSRLVEKYNLTPPETWLNNTVWAGLQIAVSNEFAAGNTASFFEKRRRIISMLKNKKIRSAVASEIPKGAGRARQLVMYLLKLRMVTLLCLLYTVKR